MTLDFQSAERMFQEDKIQELAQTPDGLLYLKIKSLSRKKYLERLAERAGIVLSDCHAGQMVQEIWEARIDVRLVDGLMREIYEEERTARRALESELISELYRVHTFDWGGPSKPKRVRPLLMVQSLDVDHH